MYCNAKLHLYYLFFAGFDFDLDEVWAPLNPHLRGALCKSGSAGSHSEGSSSSCSDSSIHTGYLGLKQPQRPPMQSVVFGDSSEDSRVPTARLSGRGCPAGGRLSQQEVCVLCSRCGLVVKDFEREAKTRHNFQFR